MTKLRCGRAVCLLLVFGLPVLATTSWAQQHNPILEKLAKTYGLDSWGQVEAFPLHLERGNHRAVQS
jgi:hypothetical protein